MKYDIFELHTTGITYKNKRGETVERATSELKTRIEAKSKTDALTAYLKTLPFGDSYKIFDDIATGKDGFTTKYLCRKAGTTYTKQGVLI